MPWNLSIHPAAEDDVQKALRYYGEIDPRLARDLLSRINVALDLAETQPFTFPPFDPPYRRKLIGRFPYHVIIYADTQAVEFLAFAHTRRRPGYWKSRAN